MKLLSILMAFRWFNSERY